MLDELLINDRRLLTTTHKIYFTDARGVNILLEPASVHLIITSPPYWSIKSYSDDWRQIGFNDSLDRYFANLLTVFKSCVGALVPGGKFCINIGDQFVQASKETKQPYHIVPLHAQLVTMLLNHLNDISYLGSINWSKVTTSNTSGGGKIMGSVYHPRNGYFFVNHEYIAVFKKHGKDPQPDPVFKEASKFTLKERREWFKDTWSFPGAKQIGHLATFPEELPYRLMRMYSYVGDTVLDPFTGSGTTNRVCAKHGRNSIGFELGFETANGRSWQDIIKQNLTFTVDEREKIRNSLVGLQNYPHVSFLGEKE